MLVVLYIHNWICNLYLSECQVDCFHRCLICSHLLSLISNSTPLVSLFNLSQIQCLLRGLVMCILHSYVQCQQRVTNSYKSYYLIFQECIAATNNFHMCNSVYIYQPSELLCFWRNSSHEMKLEMSLFLHSICKKNCFSNGSSTVNECRQNESPNNITIIHK